MADEFEIRQYGWPVLMARLKTLPEHTKRWSKETISRAANAGSKAMRNAAPEGKHYDLPQLSEAASARGVIRNTPPRTRPRLIKRISADRRGPQYSPGGAGGGGFWEQRFGVQDVGIRPISHDPANILRTGSGIRGPKGEAIRPGNVMTFMSGGKQVFATSVGGQSPNTKWIRAGQIQASNEIKRRLAELDLLEGLGR